MMGFNLVDLTDDPQLIAITDFAAQLCETPIALVSFVEEDRQWFPARTGLDARETPRELSFCAHAMLQDGIMIVPDAREDIRFADNALVCGEPFIRFYAGAPLVSENGTPLGALCVIDREPRDGLTAIQQKGLQVMAANLVAILNQRDVAYRRNRERGDQEAMFRTLADTMPQMVWSTLPDGFHDYYNARWYEFTGVPNGSTDGEGWNDMFHPEDQARAWAVWRHSLDTGEPYEIEYRLRHAEGSYRWTLGRALPIRDENGQITRWFGTCTDIHDHKMLSGQRELLAHELSHRIKNIFAVIIGLIGFSVRSYPELRPLGKELSERILALSRAHDFVRPHSEQSRPLGDQSSLHGMLTTLLSAYGERIAIGGDDIEIDDRSATPLALVFHELATNAAKYGALSVHGGQVSLRTDAGQSEVGFHWAENGGPEAVTPEREGFGSSLIKMSVLGQLGGRIDREWNPSGLSVAIHIPKPVLHRKAAI
ncbi:MAG: PAS domain-containing protein [Sphingobium sp.]